MPSRDATQVAFNFVICDSNGGSFSPLHNAPGKIEIQQVTS